MSAAICPSEAIAAPAGDLSRVRVTGGVKVRIVADSAGSRVAETRERDGYKVRFPRRSSPPEAILINTGGGIASGDRIVQSFAVEEDAAFVATTQASERVYRSADGATACMSVTASVGAGGDFFWVPQETILFDNARLDRLFEIDLAPTSRALLAETVILGRQAMGETMAGGWFRDKWRVRRDGALVFAENLLLEPEVLRALDQPAVAGGAHVITTVVLAAHDVADRLETARAVLAEAPLACAASSWNGLLVVRGLSSRSEDARHLVAALLPVLGAPFVPRVWWT